MSENRVSRPVIERLPLYLQYLKSERSELGNTISATTIAKALDLGDVQVRKDLCAISGAGKPKVGYVVDELIGHLENFLGYRKLTKAVLVGAGKLGNALLDYGGFIEYGLEVVAAFDVDDRKLGVSSSGKTIYALSKLSDVLSEDDIKIGIITCPAKFAQNVCNLLVENGILAIWNFAPTKLEVPSNILIQNENMATSLAVLSRHLLDKIN